jgi:hypothetical protein
MPNHTDSPNTPRQQDDRSAPTTAKRAKETKLDRIAGRAARRALERQQRYDRQHNIFTK